MSYKSFSIMDIYNVISRWHAGYRISQISRALQIDRKTVRNYVKAARTAGISTDQPLPEKAELLKLLAPLLSSREHPRPVQSAFEPYKQEILALITNKTDPLKPKTAYEVICERYQIHPSYSSFKRFLRHWNPDFVKPRTTCRLETQPAEEIQIDYGRMGQLYDPLTQRQRRVHAFIATLCFSRLKYVEFVYRLNQSSFVASHVRLFEFLGGVPQRVVIDNLKTGVLSPDLYDPRINRTYQELAEHYGIFIDTARVCHPKDKGKVERAVPDVREVFRKFKALDPKLEIGHANRLVQDWCLNTNGMKVHGTTGLKPFEVYSELEKPALGALPAVAFELATWKQAKVHVDQFIQFEKKFYAVPEAYVGKSVWVRGTEKLIEIFDNYQLVKQYPRTRQVRQFDAEDFPENVRVMLGQPAIQNLIRRAEAIGPRFKTLILNVLSPHAKLSYRRAQGLLRFKDQFPTEILEAAATLAITHQIYVPKQFKHLLERLQTSEDDIPISTETQELVRDANYFVHPTQEEALCHSIISSSTNSDA